MTSRKMHLNDYIRTIVSVHTPTKHFFTLPAGGTPTPGTKAAAKPRPSLVSPVSPNDVNMLLKLIVGIFWHDN